ncbi:MAG: type I DNA topoisomerase [Cellvibrio sp.]|nr:type I DNA topoisomerase [Cellvibrio sp.]
MGKSLVIVESPAKAKTINAAQKESKSKSQLVSRMGIDPENGWQAQYQILPGKEKVVDELKKLAEKADTIYLATDLDREGEAIAWHLREAIGGDPKRYRRVVFNEITKTAIQNAFKSPGMIDQDRVDAQQARRFLDRVVGYMVSPLLWEKVARGLSAGRVQSVAVRLVVEREREIRAFIPEEYWTLFADLDAGKKQQVAFEVKKQGAEAFKPVNEAQTKAAVALLQKAKYEVVSREDKPTQAKPSAPFITSTLQQAASTRLSFGVKKTMMMAQRLYEAGYITYMRTDSTNLSKEAVDACRDFILETYGEKYLPKAPQSYSSKEGAQEAHEAIRPSNVAIQPNQLSGMERDAERLYTLIWQQFVACQMSPAEYTSTSVVVKAGDFELRTRGRVIRFDGFTKVLPQVVKKDEDLVLPDMKTGQVLPLVQLNPKQHFTKPQARYTEASLVKELESRAIGRPSTYAAIISTIQERGYVRQENRRFYAEKMGDIVTERLVESFDDLMDYGFTANMENSLDLIAQGDKKWRDILDNFYRGFTKQLQKASSDKKGMRANDPVDTDIACSLCGRHMQIRTGSTGVFLGCSGYALPPKERCKNTMNLVSGHEVIDEDADDEAESRQLITKHRCKLCNSAMDSYLLDENRKLHICGNNPDCAGYEVEKGSYKLKGYEGPTLECDKCNSQMQLKTGRFGKYFGCTNTECKNTRKLLKSGEAAPPKVDPIAMPDLRCEKVDDYYVLRDGAAGLFLAASQFPKNRETRAPLVSELLPYKKQIDPKYHFLLSAPVKDPEGNLAIIRFSRKTKEQYVQTEVNGKATGWKAFFDNGKWNVSK